MYLKRLEIQGFKSFADTLKLDFNKGISAVVGPNGSGKSNIADSIRWVLGEQSAKTLRGAKMEDIIFAGTQNRKPLGFAEVTITLDNSDGKIPISFGEVSVTRRVYRSGESEYSINGTSCRLRDIYELFMDTGVGKEGYSIIGQGQIDRILSSKPEDRRFIFEEAVGIVKYKNRKLEAEKKLEIEKQNLIRIEDIISELEKQIQPLSVQAEKAKEYLSIKEKLKAIDLNIFIEEADILRKELSSLEESFSINEEELMRQKDLHTKQKEEYARIRKEIDQTEEEIFQIQNNILDIKTLIEKIEGDNKAILQDIHHLNQDITRLQNECDKIQVQMTQKDEEKVQLSFKVKGLTLELNSKKEILEEKEAQFNELTKLLSTSETEIERFKSDIIEKMNQSSELKSNIQKMKGLLEQIENRRSQIEIEKSRIKTQYKEQTVHLKALNKMYEDKQSTIHALQNDIDELTEHNEDIFEAIRQQSNSISNLTEKMHRIKSRQQILGQMEKEFEGFNKSVKNILRLKQENPQHWQGICGVVAELIKVPKGYETAIEVALGSSMQNIVTSTEEVSKKVIEYLRKNQLGRATFLPLSAIKEKELGKEKLQLLKEDGVLGIASSIISYEPIYHNVISYLLGRVIIVKDLDCGIALAKKYDHKYKIVTLDGDVFNAGGSMTGGSIYQKTSSIFSRSRELRELTSELNEIINQLEEARKNLTQYEEIKNKNLNTIEDKKSKVQELNIEIISRNHEIQQCKEVLLHIEDTKKQFALEEEQLDIQYKDLLVKLSEKNKMLNDIEKDIEEIHSKVDTHQSNIQSERALKEDLTQSITELKIQISSLEQNNDHISENMKRIEDEIQNLIVEKQKKEEEIKNCYEQTELKQKEIQENKSKIEDLNLSLKEKTDSQNGLQESKKQSLENLQQFEEKIEHTTKNIELIQQEMHRIENKKTKFKLEQDNLFNRIWEEYEETYNSALNYKKDMGSMTQMKKLSSEYNARIRNLGNINLDAINEYEKVKERYEFLSAQREDILNAEQKLRNIIQELTVSMEKQFKENFAVISSNFNEVFRELFGGGKGYLQLTEEDNVLESGIEIIAQPPGKKLQNMMLLSGGERALTAIALLFSILKMKPSPFCILDEIEAALDDANVNRFARYLKRFGDQTQFIVITHRKGTMEVADTLYGVTMQEQGISKLLSVKLSDVQENEEAS